MSKTGRIAMQGLGMPLSERLTLLHNSRFTELERWRRNLEQPARRLPHFDPLDGGAEARLLILLETPGPGDAPIRFVSRDNDTGTARNLRLFLAAAGIARRDTVLWNAVPWVVHSPGARNRSLRKAEITEGLSYLAGLLERLTRLEAVLLAGRIAARAAPELRRTWPTLEIIEMPHPSPSNVCTSPKVGEQIRIATMNASQHLARTSN